MMENEHTRKVLLSAADIQKMGVSRSTAYALLNRPDLPVVRIGQRKFMHAELFEEWIRKQAVDHDANVDLDV